jgi:predicted ATPase
MLGRERDVKTLRDWLADLTARMITVLGPGGVGKTRLAVEFARAIADEGTMRVVLAPLAAIQDAGLAACAGGPTLLVLDNLEQVHQAGRLVSELLTSAAGMRVLATSRAPLALSRSRAGRAA